MHLRLKSESGSRRLAGGLVLILALAFYPFVAFAHAKLVRSQPQANATLKQAPKTVELWFGEDLEPSMSTIVVTDQNGKHVDQNNVSLAEGNKKLQIGLEDLAPGTYTVSYKALSTDQHMVKGTFTFTVALSEPAASTAKTGQPTPGAQKPPPSKQPQQEMTMAAGSMEESTSTWSQSCVRWLEYLAMMTLFGGFAFRLLVLEPSIRQSRDLEIEEKASALERSAGRFARLSWLSIALLVLATLAALVLQTSTVLDVSVGQALSPARLSQVITRTSYGGPWLLQVAAMTALVLILFLIIWRTEEQQSNSPKLYIDREQRLINTAGVRRTASSTNAGLLWIGLGASAVMMLSPSMTGHAAAAAKEYHFAVVSDWLHMVAAAVWVGGLFHLALTMTSGISGLRGHQRIAVLNRAIPQFTRLAVASTAVLALTGVYNSWMHVDRFSELWTTPYGKTLLVKVLFFVVMVALGGINTFVIHPRTERLMKKGDHAGTAEHLKLDRSFYRSVGAEAVLGVAVLLAAAVLVFLQPAREHPVTSEIRRPETRLIQNRR